MFNQAAFNEIFGAPQTPYQKGMADCIDDKGKLSHDPEYLKGFEAEQEKSQLIKSQLRNANQ